MILSEARELLYDAVVPTIDTEENISRFDRYLNLVQERLINSGKWTGMTKAIIVAAQNGIFTLPPRFLSVLVVRSCCGDVGIANKWFAFRGMPSWAYDPSCWSCYGYYSPGDLGDGYVTFRESPYPSYYLRFTRANAVDAGQRILVKGTDPSGESIFTPQPVGDTTFEGIVVQLNAAIETTTQLFTGTLIYLSKLRTSGYIYLDAVDSTSGAATRIGIYAPWETTPCYHRYSYGCTDDQPSAVSCFVKLRYTPAVADTDEVIPSNANALRAGLAAIKCEADGDLGRRDQFLADGLRILSDEAREQRGGAKFSLRIDRNAYQFYRLTR